MWLDNASQDSVNLFWQLCGEIERFPRSLERPIALALPVMIVKLPQLQLRDVERWLYHKGLAYQFDCQSRALRGCLIALGGKGAIFVDGVDPDDERRFTLAHETAHFMIDYWQPRHKAIAKLGSSITEVIDGLRPPTATERLHALLTSTPIGIYTNLMERDETGGAIISKVWEIEDRADKVALALLAPPEAVLAEADTSASQFSQRRAAMQDLLCARFGLPVSIAASYSQALLSAIGKGPSWVETLGLG